MYKVAHELHEYVNSALKQMDIKHVFLSRRIIQQGVIPTQGASEIADSTTACVCCFAPHHAGARDTLSLLRGVFEDVDIEFKEVLP